jgi:hypothetical protein
LIVNDGTYVCMYLRKTLLNVCILKILLDFSNHILLLHNNAKFYTHIRYRESRYGILKTTTKEKYWGWDIILHD